MSYISLFQYIDIKRHWFKRIYEEKKVEYLSFTFVKSVSLYYIFEISKISFIISQLKIKIFKNFWDARQRPLTYNYF